jgi:hypothetical protein
MNVIALRQAVQADRFLNHQQRLQVMDKIKQFPSTTKNQSGIVGGGIGVAIARYLALSKPAQAMLAVAGFGIGRVLWDHYYGEKNAQRFTQFNDRIKAYEIQSR